jgi:hypothetical protein
MSIGPRARGRASIAGMGIFLVEAGTLAVATVLAIALAVIVSVSM